MLQMEIRDAVKQEARRRGMHYNDLSKRVFLNIRTMYRRLANPRELRLEDLFRLAKVFSWTEEEMNQLITTTYRNFKEKKQ